MTGGAGFIGTNLVKVLRARGDEVIVLDDFRSGRPENLRDLDVHLVEGDIRNVSLVRDAARDCEVVFHLAASVGNQRSIDAPRDDAEINLLGTLNVLEATRSARVRKLVFSSSAGIFGELKTLPIREDHPVEPDSPYGVSKLAAEKLGLAYGKLYPMEVVSLRYFNVYGRHQYYDAYGNVIPIFARQLFTGRPLTIFGDGEQTRDFVHVRDVVEANLKAAGPGVHGPFNIGSGRRVTINRLAEVMSASSGIAAEVIHGPPRPGDVRDSLADVSAARRAFAYEPTVTLEDGLRDYLAWAEPIMRQR